jgi:hypothetical protein
VPNFTPEVDYSIFNKGIVEDYRLPECDAVYHVTGKRSVTAQNAQTISVTTEITRNLARYLWVSSTSTGAS